MQNKLLHKKRSRRNVLKTGGSSGFGGLKVKIVFIIDLGELNNSLFLFLENL